MTRPGGPILPPIPPAEDELAPVERHSTMVLVGSRVQLGTAITVNGSGALLVGSSASILNLVVQDVDAARRLHEQTGDLLTKLAAAQTDAGRARLQAVRGG